jgi:sRNA-binding regulator protein Hfq
MAEPTPAPRPEIPSTAELLKWKRSGTKVHWQLMDGSSVIGALNWFDNYNVQVQTEGLGAITIPKHALLWYREASEP